MDKMLTLENFPKICLVVVAVIYIKIFKQRLCSLAEILNPHRKLSCSLLNMVGYEIIRGSASLSARETVMMERRDEGCNI